MNRFLALSFLALALFVSGDLCTLVESQVKVYKVEVDEVNPDYVKKDTLVTKVTEKNSTYNNVAFHWDLVEDLPEFAMLQTQVFVADDENGKGEYFMTALHLPLCQSSINHDLLPYYLRASADESLINKAACIKKGSYEVEDMGQLRFEHLLRQSDIKDKYYKIVYKIHAEYKWTYLAYTVYAKWGYLDN